MSAAFRDMKFDTHGSDAINAAIQEELFRLGYTWGYLGQTVACTSAPYLYAEADGLIVHGFSPDGFANNDAKRTTVYELAAMDPLDAEVFVQDDSEAKEAIGRAVRNINRFIADELIILEDDYGVVADSVAVDFNVPYKDAFEVNTKINGEGW